MRRLTAKSLTLDLLSTLRRGAMPVRALVAAGRLFGIRENSLRVGLARLLATGQVERDARGSYRLGAAAEAIDGHVQSWRRAPERCDAWREGTWAAVHLSVRQIRTPEARAQQRAIRLHGLRELDPGLLVRPANTRGGIETLRRSLSDVGLGAATAVFRIDSLDAEREARARRLWDADALPDVYARTLRELAEGEARLEHLPPAEAMVESFLLGGRAIRTIALDPLLPAPIVARGALAEVVAATRRYERAGRRCWSAFLAEYGVLHQRAPVDARVGDAARALPPDPNHAKIAEGGASA